jgi:hypothetical protein
LYGAVNQFRLSTDSILNTDEHIIEQNTNRELAGNTLVSRLVYHRYLFLAKRLAVNMGQQLTLPYIFFWGDSNLRHGTGEVGLGTLATLPLIFFGWYGLWRWHRRGALLLLWLWFISLIPASVPLTVPHALRSLNAVTVLGVVLGVGAYVLVFKTNRIRREYMGVGLSILLTISLGLYWHDNWAHYPTRSAGDWQDGYQRLSQYLHNQDDAYEKIFITNRDGRIFLYPLYYQAVNPIMIQGTSVDYQLNEYKQYKFTQIYDYDVQKFEANILYVMDPSDFEFLNQSVVVKEILYDRKGLEQFILIDTNEQRN